MRLSFSLPAFAITALLTNGGLPRATVSSFTVRRGTVDRTFTASSTAPVSKAELLTFLTVKGTLLDLSTGADVVNESGVVMSGVRADIDRRQGGDNTQIDITVDGLSDKPPGNYRVRIHYLVETNGPDIVRLRLLERGQVTSITRDASPPLLSDAYMTTGQTYTLRASGSGLQVATIDPRFLGNNFAIVSRSSTSLVFTVKFSQPGRFMVFNDDFYDQNLGHVPTLSDENEMFVRYRGSAGQTLRVVGAPSVTSVSPQPATAVGAIALTGANLSASGLSLSKIRYAHRYSASSETLNRGSGSPGPTSFVATPTSASLMATYDIVAGNLELEFAPETIVISTNDVTPLPRYTLTVPFSAAYAPSIDGVRASADQGTLSGVRILRAGSATITGKYLFVPVSPLSPVATRAPGVTLGGLDLAVEATGYVPPTSTAPGRDSLRVTLNDPTGNVVGQIRVQTATGSALTAGSFVLATRPRVSLLAQLIDSVSPERAVTTQTLFRGAQYQLTGTSLSIMNGSQVLQTGTVALNGRALTLQATPDPAFHLRFLVPFDATSGALKVTTLGGTADGGSFVVADPPAGTIATPRPTAVSITPTSVASGIGSSGTVSLDNPGASVSGFAITLTSSDTSAATVPPTITTTTSSATFRITTKAVSAPRTVSITAQSGGGKQAGTLTVTPPIPSTFTLSGIDVVSGATVAGTINFTAPASGTTVALTSSDAAAPVPASIVVSGSTATFATVTTEAPAARTVTITASANNTTKSSTVTVTPLRISSLTSALDSLRVGQTATVTATMNRGPAADALLTVATSQPSLVQFDQPTLRVAAGQTSGTIGVRVVAAPSTRTFVTITVSRSVVTDAFGTVTTSLTRNLLIVP